MSRYLATRSDWRQDYIRALDEAAKRQPVDNGLLDACADLTNRIAVLEAENALLTRNTSNPNNTRASTSSSYATPSQDILEIQRDLAEAMRHKNSYETRLRASEAELDQLRVQTRGDSRNLAVLKSQHAHFSTKTRDLEHELREKKRLLDNLQDEMITLNLQLAVAEKERDTVKAENQHLIQRFVQYKSQHQKQPVDDIQTPSDTQLPGRRR
ncbi:hypothetical protein BROUX41_003433 [Berkeleyomyces rouxiae]|uniref:uncharacterized protein n=1 Tax=Berkeleyomyces rouxiae TaxID=2035830 RepID=UPI003B7B63CA